MLYFHLPTAYIEWKCNFCFLCILRCVHLKMMIFADLVVVVHTVRGSLLNDLVGFAGPKLFVSVFQSPPCFYSPHPTQLPKKFPGFSYFRFSFQFLSHGFVKKLKISAGKVNGKRLFAL